MFLTSLHYFRGIAVLFIILGHCLPVSHFPTDTINVKVFNSLIHNGTVFFVFISGYLLEHLHRGKGFELIPFLKKKAKFIVLPYLIISVPLVWMKLTFGIGETAYVPDWINGVIGEFFWFIGTGKILTAYWYIPMAILMYLASPLILKLVHMRKTIWAGLLMLVIAMVVQRPFHQINPFQSFAYFIPAYWLGAWCSMNRKYVREKLFRFKWGFFAAAIGLCFVQAIFYTESSFPVKPFFEFSTFDLNLVQKLLLCLFFIAVLDGTDRRSFPVLGKLAEISFALYFLHPIVLKIYKMSGSSFGNGQFWLAGGLFVGVTLTSVVIALTTKKVLAEKSRFVIGW